MIRPIIAGGRDLVDKGVNTHEYNPARLVLPLNFFIQPAFVFCLLFHGPILLLSLFVLQVFLTLTPFPVIRKRLCRRLDRSQVGAGARYQYALCSFECRCSSLRISLEEYSLLVMNRALAAAHLSAAARPRLRVVSASAPQVMTSGALRPVISAIFAVAAARSTRSANDCCGSRSNLVGSRSGCSI